MKVWEIAEEYQKIEELLEESGGELTPEIEDVLNLIHEERKEKVDSIIALMDNFESVAEFCKQKESAMYAKRKSAEKRIESLKKLLAVLVPEGEKLKTATNSVSWRKNPDRAEVLDMNVLPDVYKRIKEEPDKKMILDALKQNATIDGAVLVEGELSLQVR